MNEFQRMAAEGLKPTLGTQPTKRDMFERYLKMRNDPIELLKCVRTKDEVDRTNPIKAFPWELEYIQWFVRLWQRERFLAVPKSRRMKMSWTNIALACWDVLFHVGRDWAFVSKKEDDSNELIKRADFVLKHLDPNKFPTELLPRIDTIHCMLSLPEIESRIRGYSSAADALRQYTFSGILGDECAFWPNAEEMYKGAIPTLESTGNSAGGRIVMISSTAPGFFKRLVYDKLDAESKDFDPEVTLQELSPKSPMTGITVWKNPKNRFVVFDLHYTADPAKRDPKWIQLIKSKMPLRDFQQEYEKMWDTFDGLPVYADWSRTAHGRTGLVPLVGLPLLRGWDFGLTPACVVSQLQGNQLVVLKEFTGLNVGADRFSDHVLPQCQMLYPGYKWFDFIDPAGVNRDQSDEGQCAAILDSKGLSCIPGVVSFESRRKSVERLLRTFDPKTREPLLVVDMPNCPVITRGFDGGYRYPEGALGKQTKNVKPLKDEHSHPHDALQYVASAITGFEKKHSHLTIPRVNYHWGQNPEKNTLVKKGSMNVYTEE